MQGTVLADKATPIHLLWMLCFLKLYNSENAMASQCCCDEKTLRKWAWYMIEAVASLDVVSEE
jgi:hypothetical protein